MLHNDIFENDSESECPIKNKIIENLSKLSNENKNDIVFLLKTIADSKSSYWHIKDISLEMYNKLKTAIDHPQYIHTNEDTLSCIHYIISEFFQYTLKVCPKNFGGLMSPFSSISSLCVDVYRIMLCEINNYNAALNLLSELCGSSWFINFFPEKIHNIYEITLNEVTTNQALQLEFLPFIKLIAIAHEGIKSVKFFAHLNNLIIENPFFQHEDKEAVLCELAHLEESHNQNCIDRQNFIDSLKKYTYPDNLSGIISSFQNYLKLFKNSNENIHLPQILPLLKKVSRDNPPTLSHDQDNYLIFFITFINNPVDFSTHEEKHFLNQDNLGQELFLNQNKHKNSNEPSIRKRYFSEDYNSYIGFFSKKSNHLQEDIDIKLINLKEDVDEQPTINNNPSINLKTFNNNKEFFTVKWCNEIVCGISSSFRSFFAIPLIDSIVDGDSLNEFSKKVENLTCNSNNLYFLIQYLKKHNNLEYKKEIKILLNNRSWTYSDKSEYQYIMNKLQILEAYAYITGPEQEYRLHT